MIQRVFGSTATDLSHHLRMFKKMKDLFSSGYDKESPEHHRMLLFLIMTAADLSDQTKDWKSSRNAAVRVFSVALNDSLVLSLVLYSSWCIASFSRKAISRKRWAIDRLR